MSYDFFLLFFFSGSGKTLQEATNLARAYVSKYGMSEKVTAR